MSDLLLFTSDSNRYRELPLALDGMGIDHIQEPVIRAEGMEFYQWVQTVEGCGCVKVDGSSFLVPKGSGIYLPAGTIHEYHAVEDQWTTNFLCFNGKAAKTILEALGFEGFMVRALTNPQMILEKEQEIYDIYQSSHPQKSYEISKCLYQLVMDLAVNIADSELPFQENTNPKILQAARYMENNFDRQISLGDIAESVCLSREYCCSLFKKSTGLSVTEYLLMVRMGHAKTYLIQYPDKKVKEIAVMAGFMDCSYFCAVFRKKEQYTPEEFRRVRK